MAVDKIANNKGSLPWLKVAGNRIEGPNGKPVVLNGLNLGEIVKVEQEGNLTEEYFKQAAAWGARVVRIPVHPGNYRSYGSEKTFTLIDKSVAWAKKYGMYSIIDWHSSGDIINGNFLAPANIFFTTKDETKDFWRSVATRYKDEPAVAFYEVFNEPADRGYLPWNRLTWKTWRDASDEIIDVIYAANPNAIPIVSGLSYANDLRSFNETPIRNKGVVLAAHPYAGSYSEPWETNWENSFGYLSQHYPMMLTEIGFDPNDNMVPQVYRADENYGARILNYAKTRNISWMAFVFYKGPYWPMPLFRDWQTFEPTESGAFFQKALINGLKARDNQ